jgi:hypothetical protein
MDLRYTTPVKVSIKLAAAYSFMSGAITGQEKKEPI